MDLVSVTDAVSGVAFQIIHSDKPEQVLSFRDWTSSITSRLDAGRRVNLVVACAGFMLGEDRDSFLSCQLGEIYDDNFDLFASIGTCPPVNPKPGMIVLYPLSPEVKALMSSVLNHPEITLITFDFTNHFAVLLEEGVQINMQRVVDGQLPQNKQSGSILRQTKVRGLIYYITEGSVRYDSLFARAKQLAQAREDRKWDAISFAILEDRLGKTVLVDRAFLELVARDAALIGLVCTFHIRMGQLSGWIQNSRAKVAEFQRMIATSRTPLAPSITRQVAFHLAYTMNDYRLYPDAVRDDRSLQTALKVWRMAYDLRVGEAILGHPVSALTDHANTETAMAQLLRQAIGRIRQLAGISGRV
jgi:hypothetical protein